MHNSWQTPTEASGQLLCPSYVCKPGAQLYGIVNTAGFIDYLRATLTIDDTFVAVAHQGRPPEKRFRFAGPCAKSGCKQWEDGTKQCGLIDKVIDVIANPQEEALTYCPIRDRCRWFRQRGGLACAQCSEVIRNIETQCLEKGVGDQHAATPSDHLAT